MADKPEMSKTDQIRAIGAKICHLANGSRCLCVEKDKPLCGNIRTVAAECWDIAHKTEMTREDWNLSNRYSGGDSEAPPAKAGPKRVRRRR